MLRLVLALATAILSGHAAWALTCTASNGRIPVFQQMNPADTRDVLLTTDPAVGEAAGYTATSTAFFAVPPSGMTCPAGTSLLYRLVNTVNGKHFYTASPTERDAKVADATDPGWSKDGSLAACVAAANEQQCDVIPLFRTADKSKVAPGDYVSRYTTAVRDHLTCSVGTPACLVDTIARVWPKPPAYVARVYPETYVPLTGGTAITKLADGDDEVSQPIKLPFSFAYFGKTYTQLKLTTNGLLTFNPTSEDTDDATAANVVVPDRRPPHRFIAGWWMDSVMTDFTEYKWAVTGAAPNRVFVAQWGKGAWANAARRDAVRDMQVWLYEGSGRIEIHYGPHSFSGASFPLERASVGIEDADGLQAVVEPPAYGNILLCSPKCAWGNWRENWVLAYMPEPRGLIASEVHAKFPTDPMKDKDAYVPLKVGDPGVAIATSKRDDSVTLDLGFSFQFDGQKFTAVSLNTAGILSFGSGFSGRFSAGGIPIPPSLPGQAFNFIAAWQDDMFVDTKDGSDGLLYARRTESGHKVFVAEWQNLTHYPKDFGAGPVDDPTRRQVQVKLIEGSNQIEIYYGMSTFTDGAQSFDNATAGVVNAEGTPTSVTYPLLHCVPHCREGLRDWSVLHKDNTGKPGNWPRYTKFVLTTDPQDGPTWHGIYRAYFMPAAFAPAGTSSAGHCGNCHWGDASNNHTWKLGEDWLFEALFDKVFDFPAPSGCGFNPASIAEWAPYGMFSHAAAGVATLNSIFMDPDRTHVTWMTEPGGGFSSGNEVNMPFDVHCPKPGDHKVNSNDAAKSRLRRWVLRNTP